MIRSYSSLLFWLGLTISASLMLYHTSDRVNELDRELRALNVQIAAEQESLHVLKAEWVYLANPARIEAEVQRHLSLQPTAPRRVAALQDMGSLLPLRDGGDIATPIQTAANVVKEPVQDTRTKHDRIVASLNSGHINDHMVMQHSTAVASTDKIGALIGTLGLHP